MPASALAFTLKVDEITPSFSELADPALRRRCVQAMATLVESYAVRAFDEPSLRPTSWPARKPSKATNPLLIGPASNMRQSIFSKLTGDDSAVVGSPVVYAAVHQLGSSKKNIPARPFFPVLEGQLTGNANAEIRDVVDALIGGAAGER